MRERNVLPKAKRDAKRPLILILNPHTGRIAPNAMRPVWASSVSLATTQEIPGIPSLQIVKAICKKETPYIGFCSSRY